MNRSSATREVFSVDADGVCLRGTYHRSGRQTGTRGSAAEQGRVGVLFLNPGYLPRATPSTVQWADSFARAGYPAFRVDLPGMGDSEGDLPEKMLDFVNAGGYAPSVSKIVTSLVDQFGLSGIVIMGLCAGAVSALFTAAVTPECRGLVLMDPYFFLPQERTKARAELGKWAVWSRSGAGLRRLYDLWRYVRLLVRGKQLPGNANLPLLRCWHHLVSGGTPILILKAPGVQTSGLKPRMGEFDYLEYLQNRSGRSTRLSVKLIEGTNHSFADPIGRSAVQNLTEEWLGECFPLTEIEEYVTHGEGK